MKKYKFKKGEFVKFSPESCFFDENDLRIYKIIKRKEEDSQALYQVSLRGKVPYKYNYRFFRYCYSPLSKLVNNIFSPKVATKILTYTLHLYNFINTSYLYLDNTPFNVGLRNYPRIDNWMPEYGLVKLADANYNYWKQDYDVPNCVENSCEILESYLNSN